MKDKDSYCITNGGRWKFPQKKNVFSSESDWFSSIFSHKNYSVRYYPSRYSVKVHPPSWNFITNNLFVKWAGIYAI